MLSFDNFSFGKSPTLQSMFAMGGGGGGISHVGFSWFVFHLF